VVWRFVTAGAQPVHVDDYEESITLKVTGARIVSAEVTLTGPPEGVPISRPRRRCDQDH
jgi:ABC-type Fe2+-enterobactin transport system substrate-binding protein